MTSYPTQSLPSQQRTTLVAVCGISPAIITETVWALACEVPAVVPEDVILVTTARGRRDVEEKLLSVLDGWGGVCVWEQLRRDVLGRTGFMDGAGRLQLSVRVIELPDPVSGVRRPAEDLRSKEDNAEAADFIIHLLTPLADPPDSVVIASIAGGRKTMGALLYAAMSLVGKECDRVTHVLVTEPFEACAGFFYPAQPVQRLEARPYGQPPVQVLAADAAVELTDIPFVPLRNKFSELNEPRRRSFAELVECYSRVERPRDAGYAPAVALNMERAEMVIDERVLLLTGRELALVGFLKERAAAGLPAYAVQKDAVDDLGDYIRKLKAQRGHLTQVAKLSANMDAGDIARGLSSLRGKLQKMGLGQTVPLLFVTKGLGFRSRGK